MNDTRSRATGDMATSYGFTPVEDGEKQPLVNEVFHSVAKSYDVMNYLMSMGVHRAWKSAMVTKAAPSKTRPWRSLDVAGGTGDIAFRLVEASRKNAHVTVLDINGSMLDVGRERAEKNGLAPHLDFVEANAEELPDILEAAASFLTHVEGFDIFSRPQVLRAVQAAMPAGSFSREDGLRAFGTLLRQGKINKIRGGQFEVTESTRFQPEAREQKAAG